MAIRKFRRNMKPVIWIITVFFLVSLVAGYVMSFKGNQRPENIAFKLDGKKVEGYDAARNINSFIENYTNYLGPNADRELMTLIAFNEFINKNVTLEIAKDLKIKVPSSEIDNQYSAIEKSFQDSEQFKRALAAQGYTRTTFKKEIEDNLLIEKTLEYLKNNAQVTAEEVENSYKENEYSLYKGKTFEEAKPEVEEALKQEKGVKEYFKLLEAGKNKAQLTEVADQYKNYVEKTEFEQDGFKVTNVDLAKRTLGNLLVTNGDKAKADEMTKVSIENQIKLAKLAKEKGVTVDENLPLDYKLAEYQKGLYEKLKSEVVVNEEVLKKFFTENKLSYDVFPSADADLAIIKVEPSDSDKEATKKKAQEVLKEVTPENFAQMAKKYSQGPSGPNGGELGTFSKGDMVQPFEEAVFKGEVGKVYPEPVETVFGQHIIYIQERDDAAGTAKASHILITAAPSEETLEKKNKEIAELVEKLKTGEVTFEDLTKDKNVIFSKKVDGISDSGYIPGLGYNDELTKSIFTTPIGEVASMDLDGKYFIFKKLSEVKFKEANYDELKNRIEEDYRNFKAQEELKKLVGDVQ